MRHGHPEICLFRPEIPQNAGNIARLTAATASRLHLIRPFGFSIDDRNLRRPGLDYWPYVDIEIHDDLDTLLTRFNGKVAFFSKSATKIYTDMPADTRLLVFGQETKGLPADVRERYQDSMYQIPIYHPEVRSLNLANSVAIVLYHQLRERDLLHSHTVNMPSRMSNPTLQAPHMGSTLS